jgi:hypothetical protein
MLAWSDTFWYDNSGKFSFPSFKQVYTDPAINETVTTIINDITQIEETPEKKIYNEIVEKLSGNNFKKVKKILANISTLMIFDDHDVTDDFFLDKVWVNNTISDSGSALGKRMVSNALTAYSIFQDWGNKPIEYKGSNPGAHLLENMSKKFILNSDFSLTKFDACVLPKINDLNNPILELVDDTNIKFHYQFCPNSSALYEIVATNCRTNRLYNNDTSPANLISPNALLNQIKLNNGANNNLKLSILLVGTPVFGNEIAEYFQIHSSNNNASNYLQDKESWAVNEEAREQFLSILHLRKYDVNYPNEMNHKIVILSGDVHHGFAKRIGYQGDKVTFNNNDTYKLKMTIANFCASALKNEDNVTKAASLFNKDESPLYKGKKNSGKFIPVVDNDTFTYQYQVTQIKKASYPKVFNTNIKDNHVSNEMISDAFMGFNNIGLISFTTIDGELDTTVQELYWPSHKLTDPLQFKITKYICDLKYTL